MENEIRNVFISHVHEDDALLSDLKELLARNNLDIRDGSIDSSKPNDAENPEYIKYQILAPRIQWSGAVIVLINRETSQSDWVNWEIEYAAQQGKRIIGVFAHGATDSDVPQGLELYADAVVGWNAEQISGALSGEINNWTTADGSVRPTQSIDRYNC